MCLWDLSKFNFLILFPLKCSDILATNKFIYLFPKFLISI